MTPEPKGYFDQRWNSRATALPADGVVDRLGSLLDGRGRSHRRPPRSLVCRGFNQGRIIARSVELRNRATQTGVLFLTGLSTSTTRRRRAARAALPAGRARRRRSPAIARSSCRARSWSRSTRQARPTWRPSSGASRPSIGSRCSGSTGRALVSRASTTHWSATTTSRASACAFEPRRRRPVERCGSSSTRCSPRRSKQRFRIVASVTRGASVRRVWRRRDPDGDRESLQGRRGRALEPARPHASPDQPAARAQRPLGADRGVRRPARPDGDGEHLHARARRRGRTRLREAPGMKGRIRTKTVSTRQPLLRAFPPDVVVAHCSARPDALRCPAHVGQVAER